MYDRILVPTDGSPESLEAVDEAIGLADAVDASITALFVVDTEDYSSLPEAKWLTLAEEWEGEGERALEEVERRANDAGVTVSTVLVRGRPNDKILETAEEASADAIVMATHGRSGVDRFLLGSVTERVIRSTTLPVLVIRAGED